MQRVLNDLSINKFFYALTVKLKKKFYKTDVKK